MRTCRGVGASLPEDRVEEFDRDLDEFLRSESAEELEVMHRFEAHFFQIR